MKNKSLAKNYILSAIYQVFAIIVPLITTPHIARSLLPTSVGINSYVSSIVALFSTIGLFGLSNYSVREIAYVKNDQKKLNRVFSELIIFRIILFIITFIVYIIYSYNTTYFNYYLIYSFTVMGAFFDITWLFQGTEELKVTVIRSFIIKTISVICIFAFVNNESDLGVLMLIYSLVTFFTAVTLYPRARKLITKIYFKDINITKHIIPNLKLFLPQVATLVYCQFDKIMIKGLTNKIELVGFYNQAEKIIKIPLTLITSLSFVMMPRISSEYKNNNSDIVKKHLNTSFRFSMMMAIPLTLGLIAISNGFIPWFLGDGYEKVSSILSLLSVTVVFIALSSVSGAQYLTAVNNTKALTISYVTSAIVNIILNYFLIIKFGVMGAVVGTIVAETLVFTIQIIHMKSIFKISDILKFSVKYFIAAIMMFISICLFYKVFDPSIILTFTQIVVGVVIYFVILLLLKDEMFIRYYNRFLTKVKSILRIE